MDLAGLVPGALSFVSSLMQSAEDRRRRKQAAQALERIMLEQRQDFSNASESLRHGQQAYRDNPDRLALMKRYKDRSDPANSPYGAEYQSMLQSQAMDQAGSQQALGMGALRERLQRSGLAGSGVGAAAQMAYGQNATNQALGRVNDIGLQARRANTEYQDKALGDYQSLLEGSAQNEYTFGKDYANLLSSKQYGNSALFGAAYG